MCYFRSSCTPSSIFSRCNGIVCWSWTQQRAVCRFICLVMAVRSVLQIPAHRRRKDTAPPSVCSALIDSTCRACPTRRHTAQVAAEFVSNCCSTDVYLAAVSCTQVDTKLVRVYHHIPPSSVVGLQYMLLLALRWQAASFTVILFRSTLWTEKTHQSVFRHIFYKIQPILTKFGFYCPE